MITKIEENSQTKKKHDFIADNPFRLQFLGGFNDYRDVNGDDMCYQYKLHKHLRPLGDKLRQLPKDKDHSNGNLTISIKFCNDNHNDNGVFGDFFKDVKFIDGHSENAAYSYDNTHFYYVIKDIDSFEDMVDEPVIEICFNMNSQVNSKYNDVKIVTKSEYCVQFNNEDPLCNKRGIFVTDVCGLDSIARDDDLIPHAGISYVPEAGKKYKFS